MIELRGKIFAPSADFLLGFTCGQAWLAEAAKANPAHVGRQAFGDVALVIGTASLETYELNKANVCDPGDFGAGFMSAALVMLAIEVTTSGTQEAAN